MYIIFKHIKGIHLSYLVFLVILHRTDNNVNTNEYSWNAHCKYSKPIKMTFQTTVKMLSSNVRFPGFDTQSQVLLPASHPCRLWNGARNGSATGTLCPMWEIPIVLLPPGFDLASPGCCRKLTSESAVGSVLSLCLWS